MAKQGTTLFCKSDYSVVESQVIKLDIYFQVGKWKEAESVVRNIWGEENAMTAIEELKNAAESTESKSEISWSELFTKQYYKGRVYNAFLCESKGWWKCYIITKSLQMATLGLSACSVQHDILNQLLGF